MMKMVPASRRVTEASLEPPSNPRRRAITPAGEAVADCVSITATKVHPETRREAAAMLGCINHSLRFGWVGLSFRGMRSMNPEPRDSGFDAAHRPGMTLRSIQTDIKLIGAVAADQRQFERGAIGAGAWRQAVEFKGKA